MVATANAVWLIVRDVRRLLRDATSIYAEDTTAGSTAARDDSATEWVVVKLIWRTFDLADA